MIQICDVRFGVRCTESAVADENGECGETASFASSSTERRSFHDADAFDTTESLPPSRRRVLATMEAEHVSSGASSLCRFKGTSSPLSALPPSLHPADFADCKAI